MSAQQATPATTAAATTVAAPVAYSGFYPGAYPAYTAGAYPAYTAGSYSFAPYTTSFVSQPVVATSATETTTTSAAPVVAAAPLAYPYYAGAYPATRSFVLPAAAPVVSSQTVEATSAAATTVVPAPVLTSSYVAPAGALYPASSYGTRSYTRYRVDGGRTRNLGNNETVLFSLDLDKKPVPPPAVTRSITAGQQPYRAKNLSITVVEAFDLPSSFTDKTDPYVQITVGSEKKRTSEKKDAGKKATWNETLTYSSVNATTATVDVYDSDMFTKDDLLGSATLNLVSGPATLQLKDKHGKPKGTVRVTVSLN